MVRCRSVVSVLFSSCFVLGVPAIATANPSTPVLNSGWNEIKPGGDTSCARGDEFSFFVSPGTTNRVVIDFIGGGACWDEVTCAKETATFTDTVDSLRERYNEGLEGVYQRDRVDNPLKDWHHVVIPYCTGDIHWGSNDVEYTKAGGEKFTIRHRGATNATAVLKWVQEQFSAPSNVLVTGCSAGSYGSIYWTPHVRHTFPNAQLVQLGDAGVGIITEDFFKNSFPKWNPTASAPRWIPGINPEENDWSHMSMVDLYKHIGRYYPEIRLSQFTTVNDAVQTFFYELMGGNPEQWIPGMRHSLAAIDTQLHDQFRYFVGPGEEHCILPYERFYSMESGGVVFRDWFSSYIHGQGVENKECKDCQ